MQVTDKLEESGAFSSDSEIMEEFQGYPSFTLEDKPAILFLTRLAVKAECATRSAIPLRGVKREVIRLQRANEPELKATLFQPKKKQAEKLPTLLFCHGGSFVIGSISAHVKLCERLAKEANCAVIMPDYRLAPDHRFPVGFNDCFHTLEWLINEGPARGLDPERIAVMGDSAGGAIAASLAQKALDRGIELKGQILIYPSLDAECKTESARSFVDTPLFNSASAKNMWSMYLQCDKRAWPKYASPAARKNLENLAPSYIETAEFDPLRDEGIAYAGALEASGVKAVLRETKGTIHGYDMAAPKLGVTRSSYNARLTFLKSIFAH